jgi:anthranilate phosphoribosyltransferase
VHGAGGIDELSPIGPSFVCEVVDGDVRERTIDPGELGVERCSLEALAGGAPVENAAAIVRVFGGEQGGPRDAVLLNAAGAIAAGGHAEDLREGMAVARRALDSGAASARLEELVAFSHAEART